MGFFEDTEGEEKQYSTIPEGEYASLLDNIDTGVNDNGDPLITLKWTLEGQSVWQRLVFKDTTKGVVASAMKGLGIYDGAKDSLKHNSDPSFKDIANIFYKLASTKLNKSYMVAIKHRMYNDKTYYNTYINGPATATSTNAVPKFNAEEPLPF